jgi:hypothetical protein
VFDVGQGAHGELQAVGQIGAVAEAQREAATHDVVAEPLQGMSLHGPIMMDSGGNFVLPHPFVSIQCPIKRKSPLLTHASSALNWVIVFENFLLLSRLTGPPPRP